ncbi:hypothetical protein BH18ACI1_BH18ACI1_05610 [soil metagenome]
MARWLKSLFLVFVLCGSVFSGAPFADSSMKKDSCSMKCCKHKAESAKPQQIDATNLCRTINCTNSVPNSTTTSAQMNLAPLLFVLKNFPIFQFLLAPQPKEKVQPLFSKTVQLKTFQPKYIQNLSLLI